MQVKKATTRSSYSSLSKNRQHNENALYVSDFDPVIIYHAEFYSQYLLLCSDVIRIYNIDNMVKLQEIKVKTHCACFVPFTNYICFVDTKDSVRRQLVFWNYQTETVLSKMTFSFAIEKVRASRRTISLSSLDHLYVIHFPSLKPIYEGLAGNGIKVVFDASRQGLTCAHNTERKGEVMIKNFTNIKTNELLQDIQSRSMVKTLSNIFNTRPKSFSSGKNEEEKDEKIKKQIMVQAHTQNISILRMSPNGYRIVSASIKGTVVRMYSCLNGELLSQFRMSYNLSVIVDIQFIAEGSQIVCLNDRSQLNLFHSRMSTVELLSQGARKGGEIYQQKNPTSFFSFLSFLSDNLNNQHPFSYFKLDTKNIEAEEMKQKLQAELQEKKDKEKRYITEIKEVHESRIEEQQQIVFKKRAQGDQREGQEKIQLVQSIIPEIKIEEMLDMPENKAKGSSKQKSHLLLKKQSLVSQNKFKSLKLPSGSGKLKSASAKSIGKISKKTEFIEFGEKQKILHVKGIVAFGQETNIKVLQGKYFLQLKYDPFNGGQMVEKKNVNLLKHAAFNDL